MWVRQCHKPPIKLMIGIPPIKMVNCYISMVIGDLMGFDGIYPLVLSTELWKITIYTGYL